jgi:hypothetical protein
MAAFAKSWRREWGEGPVNDARLKSFSSLAKEFDVIMHSPAASEAKPWM